jgi:TM2 domain-containing membrane protein YozV
MRNKTTAALLAILLGGLGVHKFYLGRPVQGVLYLVFCWTFIPAIVGFIEGLILLSQDEQQFQLAYKAA